MTVTTEPTIKYDDRRATADWLVREGADPQEGSPAQEYAVLTVSHHGRADYIGPVEYCFTATLGRETVLTKDDGKGGTYKLRRIVIGISKATSVRVIPNVPAKRFSRKQLEAVMQQALKAVEAARAIDGYTNIDAVFDPEN
jgi:hypothetical protein